MQKKKKARLLPKLILISAVLVLLFAGLYLAMIVFGEPADFEWHEFANTVTVPLTRIEIEGGDCRVRILLSDDGETRLEMRDRTDIPLTFTLSGSTLRIRQNDTRTWKERINRMTREGASVTLWLAPDALELLSVSSGKGDVELSDIRTASLIVRTTSGNVTLSMVDAAYEIETVSGDVSGTVTSQNGRVSTARGKNTLTPAG